MDITSHKQDGAIKAGYKQTEVGEIPKDWDNVLLGEYTIKVGSGITPRGGSAVYKKSGIPFMRSQNVGWGELKLSDIAFIDEETHALFSATEIKNQDVLLNITGASIGRCTLATAEIAGGNVNQHVCIIRTKNEFLDSGFLCRILLSNIGQVQIDSFQAGGNREGLNFGQIKSFNIPLPSTKTEQTAIAKVLSDTDALIQSLNQLIAKKRQIKQGAMQQLLNPYGKCGELKAGWTIKKLGDLLLSSPDYGINAAAVSYSLLLPKYLRITDISENGEYLEKNAASVHHPMANDYILNVGEMVFARTGASVGKTYLCNKNDGQLVFAGFLIRVRPDEYKLHSKYLKYYTQSNSYKNWVIVNSMRSGQPGINGNEYSRLPVSIPPTIENQIYISTILSDMDTEITNLETKRAKYQQIKQGMMQNLLTGRIRLI